MRNKHNYVTYQSLILISCILILYPLLMRLLFNCICFNLIPFLTSSFRNIFIQSGKTHFCVTLILIALLSQLPFSLLPNDFVALLWVITPTKSNNGTILSLLDKCVEDR